MKTERIDVRFDLTDKEKLDDLKILKEKTAEMNSLKEQFASIKLVHVEKTRTINAVLIKINKDLESGTILKSVACNIVDDFKKGTRSYISLDDKKVIRVENIPEKDVKEHEEGNK